MAASKDFAIASVDAGNGGTNAVLYTGKGKGYTSTYFPSVRAQTSAVSLGLGALEVDSDWVEWKGTKYLIGDDVFLSRNAVERHIGKARYGDPFHLFLIATALGQLLPNGGDVDLTLFAPPGMFAEAKAAIIKAFDALDYKLSIVFKQDPCERNFRIRELRILPEGLGALLTVVLDEKGNKTNQEYLSGEHMVLDTGMLTLDCLRITDGQFNTESLAHASWENHGVRDHILNPVLAVVKKQGDDFDLLQIDDIDVVLRKGITTGDYLLVSGSKKITIKPAVDKYSRLYADWITNQIIDSQFSGLRGSKSMLSIGGGAVITIAHMKKAHYGSKLISLDQFKHTKDVAPVDANAVGGLRLAAGSQKGK